jgi:flagellar motor switch/type III secretory pathway protein FliN
LVADVASGALPRSEIARLEVGDVVVLDAVRDLRGRVLGASRTDVRLVRDDDVLRVEAIDVRELQPSPAVPASLGGAMTNEESTRVDGATRASDAPIDLAIELARFRLTVNELGALRVGDVLRTGAAIGERVRLRAGETIVAEGDLVDVEGEVGVRITRVIG